MSMTITLQAGVPQEFYGVCNFLRILEAAGPLTLEFYNGGREVAEAVDVGEGYAEKFEVGTFDRVRLHSASTQVVQFVTRLGNTVAYDKAPVGDVNVLATVGLTDAQLRATPPLVRIDQESSGWWNSTATIGVNGVLTVFNAAANPNGAIIHHLEAADSIATAGIQVFLTKATAPATVVDGNVIAQSYTTSNNGTNANIAIRREQPIRIPGGVGLYFVSGLAGAAGFMRSASYRLL